MQIADLFNNNLLDELESISIHLKYNSYVNLNILQVL